MGDYADRGGAVGLSWPLPEGMDDAALGAAPFPPLRPLRRAGGLELHVVDVTRTRRPARRALGHGAVARPDVLPGPVVDLPCFSTVARQREWGSSRPSGVLTGTGVGCAGLRCSINTVLYQIVRTTSRSHGALSSGSITISTVNPYFTIEGELDSPTAGAYSQQDWPENRLDRWRCIEYM